MMREAGTVLFQDQESLDEAAVIVRYDDERVALTITLKSNGDIMALMTKSDAGKLLKLLKTALE